MKAVLCCAAFVAAIALVNAENCRGVGDCTHVTCPEKDYTLDCARGECTCTHQTAGCIAVADCRSSITDCRFGLHCVDSKCRCGFGSFGGGK